MPSKCKGVPTLQGSMEFCAGSRVLPGLRDHMYYIAKRDIVTWPKRTNPGDSGATMEKLATLTGDFVLAADKKWQRIDLIDNKGKIEAKLVGEKPSQLYENKTTVVHPGIEEVATGFCQLAAEEHFVFLIPQRNGKYRLFGSTAYNVETVPSLDTGEGTTGGGTSIEITAKDLSPAPFYVGKIEIEGGSISGATDEAIGAPASGVSH